MRHGTSRTYNMGCRCDRCRGFQSARNARMRSRRILQEQGGDPAVPEHGSYTRYVGYYCRCDPCREAASEYRRECLQINPTGALRRAKRDALLLEGAVNYGKQWTGAELEMVVRDDVALVDLARMLGRTLNACYKARGRARTDPKWARVLGAQETPTM